MISTYLPMTIGPLLNTEMSQETCAGKTKPELHRTDTKKQKAKRVVPVVCSSKVSDAGTKDVQKQESRETRFVDRRTVSHDPLI